MRYRIVADENIEVTPELVSISEHLLTLPGRTINSNHLKDADVLLVRSVTPVTASLLAESPVAFVGTATAGVEHIDSEYLARRGIKFAAAPGANANAVIEYVLSVLAARGRIAEILKGGTVGIVGYGHVGQGLARIILALGGNVTVWDPWQTVPANIKSHSLEIVLKQPIVSLHAALHEQKPWPSWAMVDAPLPPNMPAGQLFINASRGELVTEAGLQALVMNGTDIVLDVWPNEPSVSATQVAAVSLGTPHIAGYTRCAKIAATNMLVYALAGLRSDDDPVPPLAIDMSSYQDMPVDAWLTRLLLSSYDPKVDSDQLAHSCGTAVAPNDFDALRRDYKLRRELRGRLIRMPPNFDENFERLVLALGAIPVWPE